MFALCNNLTGGKGFKYNYEYVTVEYANPDEKGYFTAINNPDAMDDLEIENANSQAIIYDLQGRRVGDVNGTGIKPFMPEGIYIIRYDNGSTRKVKR